MGVSVIISKIGKMLVTARLITEEQLEKALGFQQKEGGRIGSILVKLGYIQEQMLKSMDSGEESLDILEADSEEEKVDLRELKEAVDEAPVVKLVNLILSDAIKKGASDIHIEAYEKKFRVRY